MSWSNQDPHIMKNTSSNKTGDRADTQSPSTTDLKSQNMKSAHEIYSKSNDAKQTSTTVSRPGISTECLIENQICHVTADEAQGWVGLSAAGLLIPYRTLTSGGMVPVHDPDEKPYARLRCDPAASDHKYHQRAGTKPHAFLPACWEKLDDPHFSARLADSPLCAVEGEFKAQSASDRHLGFFVPAVGIPGFYGANQAVEGEDGQYGLVPELRTALDLAKPEVLAYLGDSDTSLNWQFSHAAVRLRQSLPGMKIILPRIGLDQPKGIDDCRHEMGPGFEKFWRRLVDDAVVLSPDEEPDTLALTLLELQLGVIAKMSASAKAKVTEKVIKLAAHLGEGARAQIADMIKKPLGMGKTVFNKAVEARRKEIRQQQEPGRSELLRPKVRTYFYTGRSYYREVGGIYVPLSGDDNLQLALRNDQGLTGCPPGCDSDAALGQYLIQRDNGVAYAGELAGYPAGIHDTPAGRMLVPRGLHFIEGSSEGDATLIVTLLSDFFGRAEEDSQWERQLKAFLGWLKQARQALRHRADQLAGQAIFLVGCVDTGKTFLLGHLVTPALGGRMAECSDFFTGKTSFNESVVGSELLVVSDPDFEPDDNVRVRVRNLVKRTVANPVQMLAKKYAAQISVEPISRLAFALNLTAADLQVIPVLDDSVRGKMMVFRCYRPAGLPGEDPAERTAFRERLAAALPAFLGQVDAFQVPEDLRDGRFGVRGFYHPGVLESANIKNPAVQLGAFLDGYLAKVGEPGVRGTARELHERLLDLLKGSFGTLVPDARELGRLLSELRDFSTEWTSRIRQDGKAPSGGQRNYTPVWEVQQASTS